MAFGKLIGEISFIVEMYTAGIAVADLTELGVERDDSGFARLAKKAAKEGKPLDKTSLPGKGCPFAGTTGKGRSAKL